MRNSATAATVPTDRRAARAERRIQPGRSGAGRRCKDDITRYFEETVFDDPVSVQDIARAMGVNEQTVRAEIRAGELRGAFLAGSQTGLRRVWRIRFRDAQAYLHRIGAIHLPASPAATLSSSTSTTGAPARPPARLHAR